MPQILPLFNCAFENSCTGLGLDVDCIRNYCRTEWETAFGPVPASCNEGDTKSCGSDVGECRQGTQACTGGAWGVCTGGVLPVEEICGDGKDNNCDGQVDENVSVWSLDADGDGFGDPFNAEYSCDQPVGYVAEGEPDCDDTDSAVHSMTTWYEDFDNDGYSSLGTIIDCFRPEGYRMESELEAMVPDCDDHDPAIHPGAAEVCNGWDDNCNGQIDEGSEICWSDNPCEIGSCSSSYGCTYQWVQDGTECGSGLFCSSGQCVE